MRLYFASDIHGSDKCWLKFLSAASYYSADVLMIGGDITGKFIVPIVRGPDGMSSAEVLGVKRTIDSKEGMERLKDQIANSGQYWEELTPAEYEAYSRDQAWVDGLFKRVVLEPVARWVGVAETRLTGWGIRCLLRGSTAA